MMWMEDTDDSSVDGGDHRERNGGAVNRNRQATILLALMSVLTFFRIWAPFTGTALMFLISSPG